MPINIADAVQQTSAFVLIFLVLIVITVKRADLLKLTLTHSNELKGLAILMVLFGHIGYFLSSDNKFLWPLSVDAGVGVNIFLFLSGYGITSSLVNHENRLTAFYKKRFFNVYPAMWAVISAFFLLDLIVLKRIYPASYIFNSFLGVFPTADLSTDVNSPLWYFSLIVFYYLVFPLILVKRYPWTSAFILILAGYFVNKFNLPINKDVIKLYQTHYLAFPLGIILYSLSRLKVLSKPEFHIPLAVRCTILLAALVAAGYFSIHSGVGQGVYTEQLTSLLLVILFTLIFLFKGVVSRFLVLAGVYSYEIYLIHWPLMSRYEFLYKNFPPFLATLLYIVLLIGLGWLLKKFTGTVQQIFSGCSVVRQSS